MVDLTRRDFATLLGGAAALCGGVSILNKTLRGYFFSVTLGCGEA